MMSALGELGRTGLTAVGNSHEEAKATYERAVAVLDQETGEIRNPAGQVPIYDMGSNHLGNARWQRDTD